jgi:hypothetical protein
VSTESKFVLILAAYSVVVLAVGTLVSRRLSTAPPRVIRTVWPIAAVITLLGFAILDFIARLHVRG